MAEINNHVGGKTIHRCLSVLMTVFSLLIIIKRCDLSTPLRSRAYGPDSKPLLDHMQISIQKRHRSQRGSCSASGIYITEILEAHDVGNWWFINLLGLGDRVLGPVEIDAAEIAFLGGQRYGRLFRFVANLHSAFGINCGREGVDVHHGEGGGYLGDSVPAERIYPIRIGGNS